MIDWQINDNLYTVFNHETKEVYAKNLSVDQFQIFRTAYDAGYKQVTTEDLLDEIEEQVIELEDDISVKQEKVSLLEDFMEEIRDANNTINQIRSRINAGNH